MSPKVLSLTAALTLAATGAQAQTISCSNGAVGDTLRITINGKRATVVRANQTMRGTVETDASFYAIDLGNDTDIRINRDSGDGRLAGPPGGEYTTFRCRRGGARL